MQREVVEDVAGTRIIFGVLILVGQRITRVTDRERSLGIVAGDAGVDELVSGVRFLGVGEDVAGQAEGRRERV